jgi:phosphatidylglycerol:prolipoprotein diacylglycerol transferase
MHSVFMELGPLTIHWYGIMMALGFIAGIVNWSLLGKRLGRDYQYCTDLMFWVMVSGVLGARIAYVWENWAAYAGDPISILRFDQGGLIFYGGFVAAGIAIVVRARLCKERIVPLMDFVMTSVPLAHALGRIGCFLNGCCFGSCTTSPLGIAFPKGSAAWIAQYGIGQISLTAEKSLPVHPVQLYEAGYNIFIYVFLVWMFRRSRYAGSVSVTYLLLYAVGRFVLEIFRGDRGERLAVGMLSIAQFVSILLFVIGLLLLLLVWARKSSRSPEGRKLNA